MPVKGFSLRTIPKHYEVYFKGRNESSTFISNREASMLQDLANGIGAVMPNRYTRTSMEVLERLGLLQKYLDGSYGLTRSAKTARYVPKRRS